MQVYLNVVNNRHNFITVTEIKISLASSKTRETMLLRGKTTAFLTWLFVNNIPIIKKL